MAPLDPVLHGIHFLFVGLLGNLLIDIPIHAIPEAMAVFVVPLVTVGADVHSPARGYPQSSTIP